MVVSDGLRDDQSPSERVVYRVAEETDTDPLDLPPLFNTVDPDALDSFIEELDGGTMRFEYAGRSVTISAEGTVSVSRRPGNNA